LRRHGVPRLADLDRATRIVVRYERERPGELLHVDVKKQGRIPAGGGWRIHGRDSVPDRRHRGSGYDYVHIAVDDRTRIAYAEILSDERRDTAASFMARALGWFAELGVAVERVLTDNGACYRSTPFGAVLAAAGVAHKRTRPYHPQTNGKVERFNLTLKWEWAYATPYSSNDERREALAAWVHRYNHHRPHMAHRGGSPMSALNNVLRKYS
jgi:transposase InsO family protein